ncbi:Indoleamine 2,3-dioxygenase [Niveomyces insectorum RCEF 264]|uniref:Indoleamine 2,3-dioxygenase n=1 Tax=Niveomyces insectorum RCEF 264 TaxID=1081102 RepID=A0A167YSY3_9HYPO|nr:Indoleamine 2,3-dioxygenase [Niveomyces insectorum RCEF 264]
MLPEIPVLSDYGISPKHGFLPNELPLAHLPDPYYNKWEAVVANLQALILSRRLRGVVDRLPVLSTVGLEHDAEWRRAYCLLCFMAHGYIWGGDSPSDRLPPPIAVPLLAVAARLEVPPVATYAAVCLWNFKPLFVDEGVDQLENLATLSTWTGSLDESWFYLVSIAMEARGGPMLAIMLAAMHAVRADDATTVTACLCAFAERLDDLGVLLQRLHERCDPTMFYHRIRPFLAGSKNMADAGLPHGVVYDDGILRHCPGHRAPPDRREGAGGRADPKASLKGTGGTTLMSFLKQARDETGEPAVEEWTQRFLHRQGRAPGKNDFFFGKPDEPPTPEIAAVVLADDASDEVEVNGLAGTWTMDDDVGGLCLY